MQTTDLVLIWLVAMITAFVILLLKLAAVALVAYVAWRGVRFIRRVGVERFARAVFALCAAVWAAIAKLLVFNREHVSRSRNTLASEDVADSAPTYYVPGTHYNMATGYHDDGNDPEGIYY